MLKDFKAFILRGNVVDLAIAVVIGAAFVKIIDAFLKGIVTPLLAAFGDGGNFDDYKLGLGTFNLGYGLIITAVINFLLVAAIVFFLVVVPVNKLLARRKTEDPTTKECEHCLSVIPRGATVCASCTRDVARVA